MKFALLLVLVLCGCQDQMSAGAVPLQGVEHMRSYLISPQRWEHKRRDNGQMLTWDFTESGTFEVWVDGSDDLESWLGLGLAAGARRAQGKWTADTETLSLSDIVTGNAPRMAKASLPLAWVDGKLRIEIGGRRYFSFFK